MRKIMMTIICILFFLNSYVFGAFRMQSTQLPAFYNYPVKWLGSTDKLVLAKETKTILIFNSTGELIKEVKTSGELLDYFPSPDGENLLYIAQDDGLVRVNMDSGEKTKIQDGLCTNVQWSPSGKNFIYTVTEVSKNPGERKVITYIVNSDGSNKKILTQQVIPEIKPEPLIPSTTEQIK